MKENAFYLFGCLTWNKHYSKKVTHWIHLLTLNSSSHLANTLRIEKSHKYKRSRVDIKHYQQSKALHLCKQISSRKSARSTSKQTYQKTLVAPWTSADAYRISVSLLSIRTSNNCEKNWSNYSTFKLRSTQLNLILMKRNNYSTSCFKIISSMHHINSGIVLHHTHLWKRRANIWDANDWLQSRTIKSRTGWPRSGVWT